AVVEPAVVLAEIARITAEDLVVANARKDHGDVNTRVSRDEISGYGRGIRDRLVQMPNQLWKDPDDVWSHDDFTVLRTQVLGSTSRRRALVVHARCARSIEADRERLHGPVAVLRHHRDDAARVQTAA